MLLFVLGGCVEDRSEQTQPTTESQPTKAPDFTAYDLEGNPVSLSDFEGKPVILNFWASWCGPCKREMPEFQRAYETYGDRIHFVTVNLTDGMQETVEIAHNFIANSGYTFSVYYDTDMSGAYAYGVNAIPLTIFLDAQLNLVAHANFALDAETLQQGIEMILPK